MYQKWYDIRAELYSFIVSVALFSGNDLWRNGLRVKILQ